MKSTLAVLAISLAACGGPSKPPAPPAEDPKVEPDPDPDPVTAGQACSFTIDPDENAIWSLTAPDGTWTYNVMGWWLQTDGAQINVQWSPSTDPAEVLDSEEANAEGELVHRSDTQIVIAHEDGHRGVVIVEGANGAVRCEVEIEGKGDWKPILAVCESLREDASPATCAWFAELSAG